MKISKTSRERERGIGEEARDVLRQKPEFENFHEQYASLLFLVRFNSFSMHHGMLSLFGIAEATIEKLLNLTFAVSSDVHLMLCEIFSLFTKGNEAELNEGKKEKLADKK